jgi:hypothetical protein
MARLLIIFVGPALAVGGLLAAVLIGLLGTEFVRGAGGILRRLQSRAD